MAYLKGNGVDIRHMSLLEIVVAENALIFQRSRDAQLAGDLLLK